MLWRNFPFVGEVRLTVLTRSKGAGDTFFPDNRQCGSVNYRGCPGIIEVVTMPRFCRFFRIYSKIRKSFIHGLLIVP